MSAVRGDAARPGAEAPAGSGALRLRPVAGRRDRARFADLPLRLHAGRPGFVPPLRLLTLETLDPRRNPLFEHARFEPWLAERDGRVVGRVALVDDALHEEIHGDDLAFFGFFEAADAEVAAALLAHVEARARELGRSGVRGPINGSLNDGSGLQIDAFERPPFVMMPWNPPEYRGWIEAAGYAKVKDLHAWMVSQDGGLPERVQRIAARARERTGARVRRVDRRRWDEELANVHRIYSEAWEANWGQVPYTEAEFAHLADTLKLILDPELALLLEIEDEVVGVALGIPDLNQALARTNGRLLPFGFVPLLNRKRLIDQMRLAILGVMPEHRRRGLELVLIDEVWRRGSAVGYQRSEMSWILEDNEGIARALRAIGGEVYKRYRLYQKPL